jgi:subtilisin family serine protease
MRRLRTHGAPSGLLVLVVAALAATAAAAPPTSRPDTPGIDARLRARLALPVPAHGIAIAVTLDDSGLAPLGAARRSQVAERQQQALDALPSGSFQLGRRYHSLAGFSGWAQPAAIEALGRRPGVARVYLDGTVRAVLTEGTALVGADAAQAQGFTGSGIKVAVLDTGVDSNHPDLQSDIAAQHCFCDNHPSPNRGCCPGRKDESTSAEDDEGHGTSVAGIVTSPSGVAPDAEIVAVKVLASNGSGSFSDIAAGLDWLLTESANPQSPVAGLRSVNLSLSDGNEFNSTAAGDCTASNTANAIQSLAAAGIAVFAASGNDSHDAGISFPACAADAISVGGVYDANVGSVSWCGNTCGTIVCTDSSTFANKFVCHSNSGALLDLLAPDWRTRTSAMGGGTRDFGGTSAASPYAAAQAALLFQADGSLTPGDVRTLLTSHGPLVTNPDNQLAFPRSDVAAALTQVQGGSAIQLVLTGPGADFEVGGGTTLTVQVQDVGGSLVSDDGATQVTFSPTGNARITGVATGAGDDSYGAPGGAETVTVAGGVAAVSLGDLVPESFQVAFTNNAGLTNPPSHPLEAIAVPVPALAPPTVAWLAVLLIGVGLAVRRRPVAPR